MKVVATRRVDQNTFIQVVSNTQLTHCHTLVSITVISMDAYILHRHRSVPFTCVWVCALHKQDPP